MSQKYASEHGVSMSEMRLSSMFSHDSVDVVYDPGGPSMTRQEFAEECDINALMARYEKHGQWPMRPNDTPPRYYDFMDTEATDLREAMDMLLNAEQAFMTLPASVRKEFDNDAVKFVDFASDGANLEKLREWGLAEPEKLPDAPIRVEVVPTPGEAGGGSTSTAGAPGAT